MVSCDILYCGISHIVCGEEGESVDLLWQDLHILSSKMLKLSMTHLHNVTEINTNPFFYLTQSSSAQWLIDAP